jgi:type I restriction enzyme S subunit
LIDTFAIRCSILRLAFSGKLSEQTEADGTAEAILNRISPEKVISQTENVPYVIPDSWAWVRLADLYDINPRVEADGGQEAAFIPMERISGGFDRAFTYETQSWERASKNHTKFEDNDVAFAKITPCFENRKSFIAQNLPNSIGGGTTELIILRQKEMLPEYTYYLILDQRFISTGTASYKGMVGQQRVQSDVIKNYLIPVAPYAEQKRIIQKIEQAFSDLDIVDELQAQYADNLTALKAKLIDSAIQGKLTEQLPEDGTAEELYQQIQHEKQELVRAGKIKKDKPLPEITEGEIPFDIPDNWKMCRLGSVITLVSGTDYKPEEYNDENRGTPYITGASNLLPGGVLINRWTETPRCIANTGDVLLVCKGSGYGKVAMCDVEEAHIARQIMAVKKSDLLNMRYILYFLTANFAYLKGKGQGLIPGVDRNSVLSMIFPLPPLKEQNRIVDKLDELTGIIEA